jgi:hypothetical protein
VRKALAIAALSMLFAAACGGGSGSEGPLDISRAEWHVEDGEARAVVSGKWVRGLSTPPACRLIEGRDGEASGWPEPGSNTSPDGNLFSKEFSARGGSTLDPLPKYHVRCSVNLSTGRTLDATAPVSGETPRG